MARRKNKKRIDPRYFLHETTYRDLLERAGPSYADAEAVLGVSMDELAAAAKEIVAAKGSEMVGVKHYGRGEMPDQDLYRALEERFTPNEESDELYNKLDALGMQYDKLKRMIKKPSVSEAYGLVFDGNIWTIWGAEAAMAKKSPEERDRQHYS